ncbi:MAG: hypothetical protein RDV48_27055 [Candidatus Eremiobacteraeota bacterium]|nr:hypothetical protein [Candidatus Eremiobacteraeota bacterium]
MWLNLQNTAGTFTSQTFDAGAGKSADLKSLYWTDASTDPELKFQVAVNEDNATWKYVGPDGNEGSYFTTPGQAITAQAPIKGRYVRYRAYFASDTDTLTKTPVLKSVIMGYTVVDLI